MDTNAENGSSREKERNFNDLNDELAGRENTGRIKRFLSPESRIETREEKRRDAEFHNLLQYLLANDPEYRALYENTQDRLEEIEHAVAEALQEVNEHIARMEEEAHTLNGKKVFFSRDGKRAYTENGEEVSAADMERITRNDDAPTWEDYEAAKKEREDITRYQEGVLSPIKERINDKENPVPKDELEGILDGMDKNAPPTVKAKIDQSDALKMSAATMPEIPSDTEKYLNAPPVKSHFDNARMDIPDLTVIPTPESIPKP